jgi:hypothetical protein
VTATSIALSGREQVKPLFCVKGNFFLLSLPEWPTASAPVVQALTAVLACSSMFG